MSDKSAEIRDFPSFRKAQEGIEPMGALALEMQDIVCRAAEPLSAKDNLKGRMQRAHDALQKAMPNRTLKFWRVRAAWNGEAGCWVGAAHEDLRERDRILKRKVEAGRAKATELGTLYARLAESLAQRDENFHSNDIASLLDAARALGVGNRAVAPTDGASE